MARKVEDRNTRIQDFGGENTMGVRGLDSSGTGYGHVAGFLDMAMKYRVSQN
jgi:hypothetical protein